MFVSNFLVGSILLKPSIVIGFHFLSCPSADPVLKEAAANSGGALVSPPSAAAHLGGGASLAGFDPPPDDKGRASQ